MKNQSLILLSKILFPVFLSFFVISRRFRFPDSLSSLDWWFPLPAALLATATVLSIFRLVGWFTHKGDLS
jgi:hypothetical protein